MTATVAPVRRPHTATGTVHRQTATPGDLMAGGPAPDTACPADRRSLPWELIRTARPRQWVKNGLVIAAPFSAEVMTNPAVVGRLSIAVAALCLAASGTYFLNDAVDAPADRLHPTKRHRPVAAGTVPAPLAACLGVAVLAAALALSLLLGATFTGVVGLYVALTVAYSLWLKRIPVLDIAAVATGFLLRAIAGAVAAHVTLSGPFLLVASFAALFLVVGKRHGEHLQLGDGGAAHRATLATYTPPFTNQLLSLSVTATLLSYASWAFGLDNGETGAPWVALSVLPFAVGMLRATQLVVQGDAADPEDLLRDHGLAAAAAATAILLFLGLYIW